MRKLLAMLMTLMLLTVPARAMELPTIDESGDDLVMLGDEALLDRYAEDDATGYLVVPEDNDTTLNTTFTLLLIGSDSYFDDHRGRGDAIILVQVDGMAREIRLVSFMRDLYVPIPGHGSNRINASYIWGGEKLLRQTLQNSFGISVDAYMEVNFERMVRLIDGIGGVDVEVSEAERVQLNSILRFYNEQIGDPAEDQLLGESGLVHLTGKQALCFSRIRKIDGDAQRTARQRKVLEAAFRQVSSLGLGDITAIVMDNIGAITTDLTPADCLTLIPLAIQCRNATFETLTIPQKGHGAFVGDSWVMKANLNNERKLLLEFLGLSEE